MNMERRDQLIEYVRELHKGQIDKTNRPYWLHCARVLDICEISLAAFGYTPDRFYTPVHRNGKAITVTALFHDVLEDVPDGETRLKSFLTTDEIQVGLYRIKILTKPHNQSYNDYITNITDSHDWVIELVKFADLVDHLQRLPLIQDSRTRSRLYKKYREPYDLIRTKLKSTIDLDQKRTIYMA